MWAATGWAVLTWLKLTALLGAVVLVCWWQLGTGSGWFLTACLTAVVVQLWAIRQLAREWAYQARSTWWWAP